MTQLEKLRNRLTDIQLRILCTDETEQPELIEELEWLAQEIVLKIRTLQKEQL